MYIFIKGEVFFGEKYMKKIITLSFCFMFIVLFEQSEAQSTDDVTFDVIGVKLYNEFIPCVGGPDFNQENVDKMMKGWRALNISDDLLGAWGYVCLLYTSDAADE